MENILWEPITIIHVEVVAVSVGHFGLRISLSYYAPLQETNTSTEKLNNKEFSTRNSE